MQNIMRNVNKFELESFYKVIDEYISSSQIIIFINKKNGDTTDKIQ